MSLRLSFFRAYHTCLVCQIQNSQVSDARHGAQTADGINFSKG